MDHKNKIFHAIKLYMLTNNDQPSNPYDNKLSTQTPSKNKLQVLVFNEVWDSSIVLA